MAALVIKPEEINAFIDGQGYVKILFQTEKLLLAKFELLPGASLNEDIHLDGDEGYYVLEGTCTVLLPEQQIEHEVKKGQAYFIPAGTKHVASNKGIDPVVVVASIAPRP